MAAEAAEADTEYRAVLTALRLLQEKYLRLEAALRGIRAAGEGVDHSYAHFVHMQVDRAIGKKTSPVDRATTGELVARGMKIVHRLLDASSACSANPHADVHCWHWRGTPPKLYTETQADCCWCGTYKTFNYEDLLAGRAPRTLQPSGAFHGTAGDSIEP